MTRMVVYECDVCGFQHDEPVGFRITVQQKKGRRIADVCSKDCAITFISNETLELPLHSRKPHDE